MQQNNHGKPANDLAGILNIVAKRMGKTPEQLEAELKSGNFQSPDKVKEVMGNKDELQQLLASPQVRELLHEIKKSKK